MKLLIFAWLLLSLSCNRMQSERVYFSIEQEQLLDSLPSGSGIVFHKDSLYIISDDAPFIGRLSLITYQYATAGLEGYTTDSYRIPKPVKPDFECAAIGRIAEEEYLFGFGSGSKSPMRDSLLIVKLEDLDDQRIVYAGALYEWMRKQTGIAGEAWNIEGAVITGDKLLLMNRGTNGVICMDWTAFLAWLDGGGMPVISVFNLELPKHEGHKARLSGGAGLDDHGDILFCASIEDTPNWYTDGPVLGSYIGVFSLSERKVRWAQMLRDANGAPLKEKVESVEVIRTDGRKQVIAVADDDKGHTKVLVLRVHEQY